MARGPSRIRRSAGRKSSFMRPLPRAPPIEPEFGTREYETRCAERARGAAMQSDTEEARYWQELADASRRRRDKG
ncbi:MAG: hypothetical protein COT15_01930 [Candidatus Diapherotrites archaeon CG08_land_8_20_14_0_20_34_12]|nr:MAG: hypothetical protein COT15_01930 [Candidatus Diapherotrites archaeon CG08_land_8_20_14_0_20_34_12]